MLIWDPVYKAYIEVPDDTALPAPGPSSPVIVTPPPTNTTNQPITGSQGVPISVYTPPASIMPPVIPEPTKEVTGSQGVPISVYAPPAPVEPKPVAPTPVPVTPTPTTPITGSQGVPISVYTPLAPAAPKPTAPPTTGSQGVPISVYSPPAAGVPKPTLPPIETITEPPKQGASTPVFGTPEYTEWYYNDPAGPGFTKDSATKIVVDPGTYEVKSVDKKTGDTRVIGSATPSIDYMQNTYDQITSNFKSNYTDLDLQNADYDKAFKEADDLSKRLDLEMTALDKKWAFRIENGIFTGSDAEYEKYLEDYKKAEIQLDEYNGLVSKLNKKYDELMASQGNYSKDADLLNNLVDSINKKMASDYVKTGDGQYIKREDFDKLNPEVQKALKEDGYDAAMQIISKANARAIEQYRFEVKQNQFAYEDAKYQYDVQVNALDRIKAYKTGDSYDIPEYLRKGGDVETLKQAGFTPDDIQAAQDYNNRGISYNDFRKQYFEDHGWDLKQPHTILFSEAARLAAEGKQSAPMSEDVRVKAHEEWSNHVKEATDAYIEKHGMGDYVGSIAGGSLGLVFSPARALSPDTSLKDVSALEWGIGAAQIALIALPGIGAIAGKAGGAAAASIATKTVAGAAGALFTYETVKSWPNMSVPEKVLSVAMDTIIIGSALPRVNIKPAIDKTGQLFKATASETKQFIKDFGERFKAKTQAEANFANESSRMPGATQTPLLTEGGKLGAGWNLHTDVEFVNAVAKGDKPLAMILNKGDAVRLAKQKGLVAEAGSGAPEGLRNYYVFTDTPEGRLAYKRIIDAKNIDTNTTEGFIKYHTEVGKALGYSGADIRAYLEHNANLDIAFNRDFALKNALSKISTGIATKDEYLLKQGARDLQLVGANTPKQLGGDVLVKRAQLIEANSKDYIKLSKTKSPEGTADNFKRNEEYLDNEIQAAKRKYREVKNPETKKAIEQFLKESERQKVERKKTATKVSTETKTQVWPESLKGKYPLAKPREKTSTALIPAKDLRVKRSSGRYAVVPKKDFATKSLAQIATEKKVSLVELKVALSKVNTKPVQVTYNPKTKRTEIKPFTKTQAMPAPVQAPSAKQSAKSKLALETETRLSPAPYPVTKAQPKTAPSPETKVKPELETAPMPYPEPEPYPYPETKTLPEPKTETKTKVKTQIKTKLEIKTLEKVKTKPKPILKPTIEGNKKKQRQPELKPGSLAWQQGKLEVDAGSPGPEKVYYYAEPPDYKVKHSVNVPPKDFKQKGRTPKQTIQTIGGPVKHNVTVNMGITRATATPENKITFNSISERTPRITERHGSLGRKFPRISSRVGRLR
jgi:hypothetical protein